MLQDIHSKVGSILDTTKKEKIVTFDAKPQKHSSLIMPSKSLESL